MGVEHIELTKLVFVAFEVRVDHILEVRRQITYVELEARVRVPCQEVVQLGDGLLERISRF